VTDEPIFFASPAELRDWFEANHETASELHVGYWRKGTGRPSLTWSESVDQALCFGWIDGVRRSVDADRYRIRFTPRKVGSNWSAVNIRKIEELTAAGLMRPAGIRVWEARREDRTAIYSYETRDQASFDPEQEARFRSVPAAWEFWEAQPPGWRKLLTFYVVSAKRPETRTARLEKLIEACGRGERL